METKKLTAEEISKIQTIQESTRSSLLALGELEIRANDINTQKASIFKSLESLREEEQALAKQLSDTYGDGTIDLTTGEFTPSASTEEETPEA